MQLRRNFLKQTLATIGAGLFGVVKPGLAAASGYINQLPGLKERLQGLVVRRGDPDYGLWRQSMLWKTSLPNRYPDVIVQPRSEEEVIQAIRFAADNDLKVACRCSGHNTAGAAMRDGGLLMDLSLFRETRIDAANGSASIQPAVTAHELMGHCLEQKLAFPVATCPGVAMGGYLLGGGMGWNKAAWGDVACYSVKSADIILADGRKITANQQHHTDLFWAVRGAGPGFFGLVTRYELSLYDAPGAILSNTYFCSLDNLENVLGILEERQADKDERVSLMLMLMRNPRGESDDSSAASKVCMIAMSAFARDSQEASALLAPYTGSKLAELSLFSYEEQPNSFEKLFNAGGDGSVRTRGAADNIWTNSMDALLDMADLYRTVPSSRSRVLFSYGTEPELRDDACFSRIGGSYLANYLVWDQPADDEANYRWLDEASQRLRKYAVGHYINELETQRYPEKIDMAFSDDAMNKLAALRRQYDPDGRFHDYLGR
ncbi:MAG: FAD-binding oxidoreductase [Gammaproteobacteria bacterium]